MLRGIEELENMRNSVEEVHRLELRDFDREYPIRLGLAIERNKNETTVLKNKIRARLSNVAHRIQCMTRIHQHRVKRARLGEEFKAAVYKTDEQYTLSTTLAMAPIINTLTKHCDALCHNGENSLQFREQVYTVTWWIHLCLCGHHRS